MARRFYDLYPGICSFENLYRAFRKAAKGKRGKPEVAAFEFHLERNLLELRKELQAQTYNPGSYCSFTIHDPKQRLISAAPFRDRVVHHALCNVIEPIFERTFIADSYANRRGRGTHKALDRAQQFARRHRFVLQCDVAQFFPSIDYQILFAIISKKIGDPGVLTLVERILAGGEGVLDEHYSMVYFPGDDLFAVNRPRGLPIGNLTSQFWANVYLNELDQFVKRELRCRAYLRYVDDFLLFAAAKSQLWEWKSAVRDFLRRLRLTLHERESTVYPVTHGIPFLGFRIYPTHRRLKRRNAVAFARRLRFWHRQLAAGEMTLPEVLERIRGWIAHARHGDTWRLRRSLLRQPFTFPRSQA